MRYLFLITALLSSIALAAEKPKAAATAGSIVITEDELNREVGNRLLKIRTDEYNLKRAVLERLLDERLLAAEAARRHVTADELTKEIGDGRKEFVASLRKAAGAKVLLEPPRATVEAIGPSRGAANAPVTIVEFSDFECPACSRVNPTVQKLTDTYGDKIRFVHRDFPLSIHPGAPRAAEAAYCAGEQEQYWPMHDKLFSRGGGSIAETDLRKYAFDLGLDIDKFDACLGSGKYTETWKAAQEAGKSIGVSVTPTFFINGRMIAGAMSYEFFARTIDEELARRTAAR